MSEPTTAEMRELAEACLATPAEPCAEIDSYNKLMEMLTPQTVIGLLDRLEAAEDKLIAVAERLKVVLNGH